MFRRRCHRRGWRLPGARRDRLRCCQAPGAVPDRAAATAARSDLVSLPAQGRGPDDVTRRLSEPAGGTGSMSATPQLLLGHHLKALRLPTFLREYDKVARQCAAEARLRPLSAPSAQAGFEQPAQHAEHFGSCRPPAAPLGRARPASPRAAPGNGADRRQSPRRRRSAGGRQSARCRTRSPPDRHSRGSSPSGGRRRSAHRHRVIGVAITDQRQRADPTRSLVARLVRHCGQLEQRRLISGETQLRVNC